MQPAFAAKWCFLVVGHSQTCVFPGVCLRTDSVSGKLPLLGQGIWWLPIPLCPRFQDFVGRQGRHFVYLLGPFVPGEVLYQIHRQSLNTHIEVNTGLVVLKVGGKAYICALTSAMQCTLQKLQCTCNRDDVVDGRYRFALFHCVHLLQPHFRR